MTKGLTRVEKEVREFRDKVEQCHDKYNSNMADIKDAYGRLNRARDRYLYEKKRRAFDPIEIAALCNVFEEDNFIEGMGRARGISEHVETGPTVLCDTNNSTFTVTAASSAAAVFAAPIVYLPDVEGVPHRWDHLEQLAEAERRIARAIAKARKV